MDGAEGFVEALCINRSTFWFTPESIVSSTGGGLEKKGGFFMFNTSIAIGTIIIGSDLYQSNHLLKPSSATTHFHKLARGNSLY
jgi:hypothetical protein